MWPAGSKHLQGFQFEAVYEIEPHVTLVGELWSISDFLFERGNLWGAKRALHLTVYVQVIANQSPFFIMTVSVLRKK